MLTDGDKRGGGCQEWKHARIDQVHIPNDASAVRIQYLREHIINGGSNGVVRSFVSSIRNWHNPHEGTVNVSPVVPLFLLTGDPV